MDSSMTLKKIMDSLLSTYLWSTYGTNVFL